MKKLITIIIALLLVYNVYGADQWDKAKPALNTTLQVSNPEILTNQEAIDRLLSRYRNGMKLTYNSATSIDVGQGEIVCSNSGGTTRKFRATTGTTNVTWADIDTGTEAASTTYYVYAVADTDITGCTFSISTSATAPSGTTHYRRLGSFVNDASSNISDIQNDGFFSDLGTREVKASNTTYQATTDGSVEAHSTQSTSDNLLVSGQTDSASSPTTEVQKSEDNTANNSAHSVSFSVKKGDYWRVAVTSDGSTTDEVYWIPKT